MALALDALKADTMEVRYSRLRAALDEPCPHPPGQLPSAQRLGAALRCFRGRVAGGKKLQTGISGGTTVWFVEPVGAAPLDVAPEPAQPEQPELPMRRHWTDDPDEDDEPGDPN